MINNLLFIFNFRKGMVMRLKVGHVIFLSLLASKLMKEKVNGLFLFSFLIDRSYDLLFH